MKAVVMPLLGADPINQAYHYLAGNRAALPGAIYAMMVIAGFGEETVFRGYLSERFGKLLGRSAAAKTFTVLITASLRGAGARRHRTGHDRRAGAGSDLRNQCGLILCLSSENDLVAVR